ncbi:MAG: hypothetical protein ABII27_08830 [bacterium]
MIRYFFCIFLVLLVAACSIGNNENLKTRITIEEFKMLDAPAQVNYMLNLREEERMEFLAKYLPGSAFSNPPSADVKFFSDGKIIFDWLSDKGGYAGGNYSNNEFNYYLGDWKYDGKKIIVNDTHEYLFDKHEEWIGYDVSMANNSSDRPLAFSIIKSDKNGHTLIYIPYEEVTPAIDAYSRLKQAIDK